MQLCKNKGMYDVCMQLWKYIQIYSYWSINSASVKVWKYLCIKFTSVQVCKYLSAFMHVCKYTKMPESKYERKNVCKFLSIWLCNQFIATLGSNQLEILQVGLQSGMIMYLYIISPWSSEYKPLLLWPDGLLKFYKQ